MYAIAVYGVVLGLAAPIGHVTSASQADSPLVLIQSGTGAGPGTGTGLDTGKSGTGKETDAGRGTIGKKSPFGSDQPTSGDFSPNPPAASGSQAQAKDPQGLEQPSGIGEKGSGQTRSTTERSGGPQPSASESMSKSSAQHGEGKSERAAKDLHSQTK